MITIICALLCASIFLFFWLASQEVDDLTEEDREYKDPLPPFMRMIWPTVRWAERRLVPFTPSFIRRRVDRKLVLGGLTHLIDPGQFLGLKIVISILAIVVVFLMQWMLGSIDLIWLLIFGLLGYFMPDLWVNDLRKIYVLKVSRELPSLLDFLTLGIESGQNLIGAIRLTISKAPPGPLRAEFARLLRDISAGQTRAVALSSMQERVDVKEVTMMVSAMIQAEKVGSSLGPVLRDQAMQRRTERFLLAEKKAFEAPVKMIMPLVIFIFPCVFAFLAYFIYQKVAGTGLF